jgi:hypothetical protein
MNSDNKSCLRYLNKIITSTYKDLQNSKDIDKDIKYIKYNLIQELECYEEEYIGWPIDKIINEYEEKFWCLNKYEKYEFVFQFYKLYNEFKIFYDENIN